MLFLKFVEKQRRYPPICAYLKRNELSSCSGGDDDDDILKEKI